MTRWILGPALAAVVLLFAGCAREPAPFLGVGTAAVRVGDDRAWADPAFDDSGWERRDWGGVAAREIWWLRSRVDLPAEIAKADTPLGLYLVATAASEVYWDGRLLGTSGRVGANAASEIAGPVTAVHWIPPDASGAGEHLLAIRFSAHRAGARISTPVDSLFVGPYGSPRRFARDLYLPSLIAGGALALAAIFLLFLRVRGPDPTAGWLGLAAFGALLQLVAETSRAFVDYDYTWHAERLGGIGVAAVVTGTGMLGFGLRRFLSEHRRLPWLGVYAVPALALVVFGGLGDEATFLVMLAWMVGSAAVAALGVRRGVPGAGFAVAGFVALMLLLWIDGSGFLDRSFFLGLVVLLLLFFLDHVRNFVRARTEREQARLRAARLELELVKRHIQPHFLLNTLATLGELIETDPARATAMIDRLGHEFRLLHELGSRDLVDLAEELELCRSHLETVQLRYASRFELAVEGDPRGVRVPPAVLHTLIENALTHNRYEGEDVRFRLEIETTPAGRALELTAPRAATTRGGVGAGLGTDYVVARLEEAFGPAGRLEVVESAGSWTSRLEIPA